MRDSRFVSGFSWRVTSAACGFVATLGIIALALGHGSHEIAAGVFWMLNGSTVVVEMGCACVVFGYGFVTRSVDGLLVGAAYFLCAFLGAQYTFAFAAGDRSVLYLWLVWHAAFSSVAVIALVVTVVRSERRLSTLETVFAAIAMLVGTTAAAYLVSLTLQAFHPHLSKPTMALEICTLDVLAIAATVIVSRFRETTFRTLCIGFFASLVDTLIYLWYPSTGDGRYPEILFGCMAASVTLISFVSEFTWRRALAKTAVAYSSSSQLERKLARERLLYLAFHDELTGLDNRTHWQDILRERLAIAASAPGVRELAVLFIDPDRFKEINDAAGHAEGDAVLVEAAIRLRACVGANDAVGRLGGDEFAILCDGSDPDILAKRILKSLRTPFVGEHFSCDLGATIGVARFPQDGLSVEELLRNADQALYHGKRRGGQS